MTTRLYRSESGDTLKSVAAAFLGSADRWPELAHVNGIRHPYMIKPGQLLEIPARENAAVVMVNKPNAPVNGGKFTSLRSPATWGPLAAGALFFFLLTR